MDDRFHIRRLPLQDPDVLRGLSGLLRRCGLRWEADVETAFGIYQEDGSLIACGCAAGRLLKCFAVDPLFRGENLLGVLISALTRERFEAGIYDLLVVTARANEPLFSGCGFFPAVRTEGLVLLENRPDGPERFAEGVRKEGDPFENVGACVMNCNPFTLGHRALIEYAAGRCALLYVFVLSEERSEFPAGLRLQMVREGCRDLGNVRVCPGGPYMISGGTFPTYFLKDDAQAAALQSELDLTLFAERIAAPLHITGRFAGSEPADPVTAQYNEAMRRILPRYGIDFFELPRVALKGETISASKVRSLLRGRDTFEQALALVPESTRRYLIGHSRP